MNIRFELRDKKTKMMMCPDTITFHRYGHFTFEVLTEEGEKLGTDEDFELFVLSVIKQDSVGKKP